ncbi:alpha/beta hydrolase [Bacillus sp. Gen3]|nr:alpha/beta hydrolase [Bacillus sp. Gen3]
MVQQVSVEKNIVYGKTETEYLTADLYRPSSSEEDLPILVLIHGGAFKTGSKEMYMEWGSMLAQEGYFVMAINYRLATPNYPTYPGILADMEQAMNWLVFHANERKIDVEKIGLIGDSAGAYIAAFFALKYQPFSYQIRSVIGVYGVYDLVEECVNPVIERENNMFELFLGLSFDKNERAFKEASPIHYIEDAVKSPTFDTSFYLIWGGQDRVVNPKQSLRFYEKLKEANVEVKISEIDDKGHFWFNLLPGIEGGGVNNYPNNTLYPEIVSFLNQYVRIAWSGNFSKRQIHALAKMENLTITK